MGGFMGAQPPESTFAPPYAPTPSDISKGYQHKEHKLSKSSNQPTTPINIAQ